MVASFQQYVACNNTLDLGTEIKKDIFFRISINEMARLRVFVVKDNIGGLGIDI